MFLELVILNEASELYVFMYQMWFPGEIMLNEPPWHCSHKVSWELETWFDVYAPLNW
jgi:hypothetical protein